MGGAGEEERRGREGGREANGGVVFLVPVTQLERRLTNKRILCPGWLPCKLRRTLLRPLFVLKHTEDAVRPLQHKAADNGHYCTHSSSSLINALGKVLIAVLDLDLLFLNVSLWNDIKAFFFFNFFNFLFVRTRWLQL